MHLRHTHRFIVLCWAFIFLVLIISLFNSASASSNKTNPNSITQDDYDYRVEENRRSLLNYYNSQTMTHGGYLIALAVSFATLVSRWSNFKEKKSAWVILLFLVAFIMSSAFYIGMRTRLYGYLANEVMRVKLETEGINDRALMEALHTEALIEIYKAHWELSYFRSLTIAWVYVFYMFLFLFVVLLLLSPNLGLLKIISSILSWFKRTLKSKGK